MDVGKLEHVPLREVWRREAQNFTKWLENNIEDLGDAIDLRLTVNYREGAAGDFSVDLVGEDEDGGTVIIENQLGRSDHPHLGQLLTYFAVHDAKTAIWIVEDARPEHVAAVTWLNESSSGSFYLVKVSAVRIDGSRPAALFTLITGPTEDIRRAGEQKRNEALQGSQWQRFWVELLDHSNQKTNLHSGISPGKDTWISTGAGVGGVGYNYSVSRNAIRVEVYLSRKEAAENKRIFDQLAKSKAAIEEKFGVPLYWQRLDDKRACRISFTIEEGGWADEEKWPQVIEKAVDAMVRLEAAMREPIKAVKVKG